ncbi:hypothetical protein F0L68_25895 [Solihabitans fulvus]|uniref:Small secreted domain n=1 Tax=Solihabitans fulvus TaxID=1892852 RepID=A0A5B2X0Z2_9PSEU|nr:hypothetical protein [Solihabitans fulvus]KAA2256932.1 hypothetical protein F0L68_25895 [Solihabitans fulvus]
MQTWAKRGIQSALVTGGLLMLGTGIASAQENVNPDQPPPPLDASVSVPVQAQNDAVGTPIGQIDVPPVNRDITVGTGTVTGTLPTGAVAPAQDVEAPVVDQTNPLVRGTADRIGGPATDGIFRGNSVQAHVLAPVDFSGNAIAAGGDAVTQNQSDQDVARPNRVTTDGDHGALAGNVVDVEWALPFLLDGNAISLLGNAESENQSSQEDRVGGDVTSDGDKGTLSGTIVDGQWATPVQFSGNSVAGGGNAETNNEGDSTATSCGSLFTSGKDATGSGTIGGVPIGVPIEINGLAVSGIGNTNATSQNSAVAQGGSADRPGVNNIPAWAHTNGDPSTVSGNVVQPQAAGTAAVDDDAVSAVGNSTADSSTNNQAKAGGFTDTSGTGSAGAGNIVDAPVALPVNGGGDSVAGAGNANTTHDNTGVTQAGDGTYTNGDNSTLSANTASVPPATAADVCGDAVGGAGNGSAQCSNNVDSRAGGYNGTTGNDSTGSGNIGQTPTAVPLEAFGDSASAAGNSSSPGTTETKDVRSGGTPNSNDDNGTASSNVVTAPTALGGQVFGDSAALVGNPSSSTDSCTTMIAGGDPTANGKHGAASGNIVQAPTSNPAQVFGSTVVGGGNGTTDTTSNTTSKAGGNATSHGDHGSVAGNIIGVPEGSAPTVAGDDVDAAANDDVATASNLSSKAGGASTTGGDFGSISGDVITAEATPLTQEQGDSVAAAGNGPVAMDNASDVDTGGPITTSGQNSSVSGSVIDAPVTAQPQVDGDPIAAAGSSETTDSNTMDSDTGGPVTTDGSGTLSGTELAQVPATAETRVHDVPVEVVGQATDQDTDEDTLDDGNTAGVGDAPEAMRGITLPTGVDHLVQANELPSFAKLDSLGNAMPRPAHRARSLPTDGAGLPNFAGKLPVGGSALNLTPNLGGLLPQLGGAHGRSLNTLPNVNSLPVGNLAKATGLVSGLIGGAHGRSLSGVPAVPAVPSTDAVQAPSLSNIKLDPAGDALKTGQAGRSFQTPALSALDTAAVQRTLTGQL